MNRLWFRLSVLTFVGAVISGWWLAASSWIVVSAQEQTVTDTPTSSAPSGMYITVPTTNTEDHVNVRMGPSVALYPDTVGILLRGATAPALGRSPGGDWIQIEFPSAPGGTGWVYSPLVAISPGTLRIVEPPPTPVPPPTATIDPTLAAQFNVLPTSTRLPTFTPPPSLNVPVFTDTPNSSTSFPVPLGTIILVLGSLGATGILTSLLGRR